MVRFIVNLCKKLALCGFSLVCLLSCGLDVVYYLDYIRPGYITDVESTVQLPSSSYEGYTNYFNEFMIFYRIYTSGQINSAMVREDDTSLQQFINTALRTDINVLSRYTDYDSTTISTSNMENIFMNDRKYYRLALEGANIASVLSGGSLGKELVIRCTLSDMPTLTLRDANTKVEESQFVLFRGDSNLTQPLPDNRYFLNHQQLYSSANAQNANINPDVATNSSTNPEIRYTYICLYIIAKGKEYLTTIYSQPTYLGVFRLPESSSVL